MPIYEYQCKACGHRLEVIQGINEKPLTICPSCHKAKLAKLVSAPSFQLKGTGWYATDFKNSGKKATPSEGDTGSSTTDSSDTKAKTTTTTDKKAAT